MNHRNIAITLTDLTPLIYKVRDHRVMLDRDLALMYGIDTRRLNQAVRRNRDRFPDDFMLSLTRKEIWGISQIVTSSPSTGSLKYAKSVFAFTEQGVAMLSSVLKSSRAVRVNIAIMRAFVQLRETLLMHKSLIPQLESLEKRLTHHDGMLGKHAAEIHSIFQAIRQLMEPRKRKPRIGFKTPE